MDVHQQIKNTDDRSPMTYAFVVKQSLIHFEEQADDKMQTKWTNSTGTNLQHLNEDCLLEIFSSKSLTPMDLCSLAETCTRFERITQRVFPKEVTIDVGYNNVYEFKSKDYLGSNKSAHDVERIFKNFESCLSALSFRGYAKEDFLDLLPKYCVGTLKKLKISSRKIPEVKLKPIFKQLQQLDLRWVTIEGGANVFANCESLTELNVTEVWNAYVILENIFPKLERFSFCFYDEDDRELHNFDYGNFLSVFISRHKSVKTFNLDIGRYVHVEWTGRILKTIGNNCKELEELEICESRGHNDFSDLHDLQQLKQLTFSVDISLVREKANLAAYILQLQPLKSLETLKIGDNSYGFDEESIPALALLTNLRELHLLHGLPEEYCHQLVLLTQLTKLYVNTRYTVTNVVDIIRRMTNLEELTIYGGRFVLCEKSFSEIVEIVKGRPRVLTLKCEFDLYYNLKNCDENQNVRFINTKKI